jgi:hypothetical protein
MLIEALHEFEGAMLFVSNDRTFLRGLSSRVLELGGESGTETEPQRRVVPTLRTAETAVTNVLPLDDCLDNHRRCRVGVFEMSSRPSRVFQRIPLMDRPG